MKASFQSLKNHKHFDKAVNGIKLVSVTGGVQMIVQGTTILSGFIIVRLLSVEEYAFYTLATTMLSTMTILADSGISSGVMSEAGKVWKSKPELGTVLATGINLRRKFAVVSLAVSIPILFYLLSQHHAKIVTSIFICLCLIPAFLAALSDSLYEIPLKLHQKIFVLQRNQFIVSVSRLVLTVGVLIFFPFTALALLGNGIPRSIGNIRLKKTSAEYSDSAAEPDAKVQESILKLVKRIMPTAIYYCVSGQITIWLVSFFGSTSTLASFGALGRISAITGVFTTMFATLIIPRFARLKSDPKSLVKNFITNQAFMAMLCAAFILFVYLFSTQILVLLGKNYKGLESELLLLSISGCLSVISQSTNGLLASRGLIISPLLLISTTIIVQVAGLFIYPVTTIRGVIFYGISTTLVLYLMRLIFFYYCIKTNKIQTATNKN
jgi:O-antigen/teichoic acid export membrane protein